LPDVTHNRVQPLAGDSGEALSLCFRAVAPQTSGADRWDILEELEILLPTLGAHEIEDLLGASDYCGIRGELLAVRADTWFERECGLARRWLDHCESSVLRNLFCDHIPREAYADELSVLQPFDPQRILIIGSGACPMSAVVVQDAFPAATVVGLDRSAEACELSARLLSASGYAAVTIRHGEAGDAADVAEFDCIIMALTVGTDESDKLRIISDLKSSADPGAILAVRTAVDWGRVLYPSVYLSVVVDKTVRQPTCPSQQRSVAVPVRMDELRI
jgi:SAM-dependent methyltransferase